MAPGPRNLKNFQSLAHGPRGSEYGEVSDGKPNLRLVELHQVEAPASSPGAKEEAAEMAVFSSPGRGTPVSEAGRTSDIAGPVESGFAIGGKFNGDEQHTR